MYLSGSIPENRHLGMEVRCRIQAGVKVWRKVEKVMMDREISRKSQGKFLNSCVMPAHCMEMAAQTEQRHRL